MAGPLFPQEILETILDFGSEDNQFLMKCALVCRDWIYPSCRHLFSTINILNNKNRHDWDDIIQAKRVTLLPHVREMNITGPGTSQWSMKRLSKCFFGLEIQTLSLETVVLGSNGFLLQLSKVTDLRLTDIEDVFDQPLPLHFPIPYPE
ncbi:hypothetical protein C8J56DRAFT_221327 [Mycena floridula]|nr:hypothetical protein C8J56DRAFT_221327 [Mycena floridula]